MQKMGCLEPANVLIAPLSCVCAEEEYTRAATPDASRQGPRARMGGSSAEGVSAPARRSFLSDNTR